MNGRSRRSDQCGLEQAKLGETVHLTFNELEHVDLPFFNLAVGPRLGDRRAEWQVYRW